MPSPSAGTIGKATRRSSAGLAAFGPLDPLDRQEEQRHVHRRPPPRPGDPRRLSPALGSCHQSQRADIDQQGQYYQSLHKWKVVAGTDGCDAHGAHSSEALYPGEVTSSNDGDKICARGTHPPTHLSIVTGGFLSIVTGGACQFAGWTNWSFGSHNPPPMPEGRGLLSTRRG